MDDFDDKDVIKQVNDNDKRIREKAEELTKKINEQQKEED